MTEDNEKGIYDTEAPDVGRIKDPGAAEEVAHLEKPAREREAELERQAKEGLTERERANLEIMSGLKEKYPDALESRVDDKGREILILPRVSVQNQHGSTETFFTQHGHISVEIGSHIDDLNMTGIVDFLGESGDKIKLGYREFGQWSSIPMDRAWKSEAIDRENFYCSDFAAGKVDLNQERVRKNLSAALVRAQELGMTRKEEQKVKAAAQTPGAILADL